ncbi:MAG: MATE family efflux transporter [Clostridia bacterium]|nr:MATE family efflux transporter [Clostridia bacterium]
MILTRDKSFYKNLFLLAVPIALQNLVTFSVGLADTTMIGSLGDTAVSGVYMGNMVQTLLQVFSGGIEGAILIFSAQYWGKRDLDSIRKIVAIGIRFSVIFGALLNLVCAVFPRFIIQLFTNQPDIVSTGTEYLAIVSFSYAFFCWTQALVAGMRSVEKARVGLYVSLCSLAVDVSLNYVLIFGKLGLPALGVRGAAIATLIARIIEAGIVTVYVFVADKKLSFRFSELTKTDKLLLRDFLRYGTPIMAGQLVWASNLFASSAIMGRFEEPVVAGLSLTNTLNNLCYVVMNGMAGAVGIITGKTIGAGKEDKMREYAKTVQVIFLVLGLLTSGFLQLIRNPFFSLFKVSAEAIAEANKLLNVLSVTIIGTCYQCACLFGLVKSGGDISFVFKNDCIFIFLIVIPSALITAKFGLAPWIVFACLKSDQILKCFVAAVKINRFRWMKNLTRDRSAEE